MNKGIKKIVFYFIILFIYSNTFASTSKSIFDENGDLRVQSQPTELCEEQCMKNNDYAETGEPHLSGNAARVVAGFVVKVAKNSKVREFVKEKWEDGTITDFGLKAIKKYGNTSNNQRDAVEAPSSSKAKSEFNTISNVFKGTYFVVSNFKKVAITGLIALPVAAVASAMINSDRNNSKPENNCKEVNPGEQNISGNVSNKVDNDYAIPPNVIPNTKNQQPQNNIGDSNVMTFMDSGVYSSVIDNNSENINKASKISTPHNNIIIKELPLIQFRSDKVALNLVTKLFKDSDIPKRVTDKILFEIRENSGDNYWCGKISDKLYSIYVLQIPSTSTAKKAIAAYISLARKKALQKLFLLEGITRKYSELGFTDIDAINIAALKCSDEFMVSGVITTQTHSEVVEENLVVSFNCVDPERITASIDAENNIALFKAHYAKVVGDKALEAMGDKKYSKALVIWKSLFDLGLESPKIYLGVAKCFLGLNKSDQAFIMVDTVLNEYGRSYPLSFYEEAADILIEIGSAESNDLAELIYNNALNQLQSNF